MCGIIGYIGNQNVVPILIDGLKRLEYRGYDSAGIAFIQDGKIEVRRSVGKLINLEMALSGQKLSSTIGIGHTRWATHGRPSEENAHPHRVNNIVVVHNGIIENYTQLKKELISEGRHFSSETDTEVIARLIDRQVKKGLSLVQAVQESVREIRGAYAIAVFRQEEPEILVGARNGCPLVAGLSQGVAFLASDIPAILSHTRDVIFLDDREIITLTPEGIQVMDIDGNPIEKELSRVIWNPVMAEKGGYKHFMLKEIYEQPRAITDTIRGRLSHDTGNVYLDEIGMSASDIKRLSRIYIVACGTSWQDRKNTHLNSSHTEIYTLSLHDALPILSHDTGNVYLDEIGMSASDIKRLSRIYIVACGTSWHAALTGKFMIEEMARIPVEVDVASEFRYRDPIIDENTLLIAITQSGETADTLAAIREARGKKGKAFVICNVVGSTAARESDGVIYTHAGPEIGVAATKTFTAQLAALYLLALYLGRGKGAVSQEDGRNRMDLLSQLPALVEKVLEKSDKI